MKLNEITNSHAEIEALLKKYKIENYTIRPDGTVDVDGDVDLGEQHFITLPFKFGKVRGNFSCDRCPKLKSLGGAPSSVGGDFNCRNCSNLISLEEGAPSSVGGSFWCYSCPQLLSLNGAPSSVGVNFGCYGCPKMTMLEGFGVRVSEWLFFDWPNIKSGGISLILSGATNLCMATGPFLIIEKYLGRPEDIFECQLELIEAGFADNAVL